MKSTSLSQSGSRFPTSSRTRKLGKKILKETNKLGNFFFRRPRGEQTRRQETVVIPADPTKRVKGSVGEGEVGKKAKVIDKTHR
jgi:hypothetical protein